MLDLKLKTRYAKLCLAAAHKKIPNELTLEDFTEIVKDHRCHYCNCELETNQNYQVDRKDSKGIYSVSNCVPCCTTCNYKKGAKLSYDEMMVLAQSGVLNQQLEDKSYSGINVDIIDLKNPIKPQIATPISLAFYEIEFEKKRNTCLSIIATKAGSIENKIGARKLKIKDVPTEENVRFLNENHIKGYSNAPAVGLYREDELLMLLSYKISKTTKEMEVHRLATKNFHVVQGGFSRLLKHLTKIFKPPRIFSYVDLRYHTGSGLLRLGFIPDSKVIKSWHWTDGTNIYNRLRCKANMDDRRLTQKEHAEEFGWTKLHDAGQQKFIKVIDEQIQKHSNYNTETWEQMKSRLSDLGFNVITSYEQYRLLERHKNIEVACKKRDHHFYRDRYRLQHLTECPDCKGLRRRSSFKEQLEKNEWKLIEGVYETKNSYLTCECSKGHQIRRQYRWFRDNKCLACSYENNNILKKVSNSLGGTPIERKRKVFEQIMERCKSTSQTLQTSWNEFLETKKTSATIPIRITCKYGHTRSTIWQVAKEHGCGCSKCRSESRGSTTNLRKPKKVKVTEKVTFDDSNFKVGAKYNYLTVQEIVDAKNIICSCDCGEDTVVPKYKLVRGVVKSCGCKQWDKTANKVSNKGKDALSDVDAKLNSLGYQRLEGVVNADDSRLLVRCLACKAEKEMNWNMIRGTCKNCYHIKQTKSSFERVMESAKQANFKIADSIEEYLYNCENKTTTRNSLVKINVVCPNGHDGTTTSAAAISKKWRCVKCIREQKLQKARIK